MDMHRRLWWPGLAASLLALVSTPAMAAGPSGPDFNGDGYADLAIGAPYANIRVKHAGAVHVFYGSATGIAPATREVWSQARDGVGTTARIGDQFGGATAAGDFDGDGYSDLAIGTRFKDKDARNSGVVQVLYGSASGLTGRRVVFRQGSNGVGDRPEKGDHFGRSLAAHDFDGDGYGDLAIGVQDEDRGGKDAGVVHVLYGGPGGLSGRGSQVWHQDRAGIADRSEAYDGFGRALTAGDFDGDGYGDLAVGVPYENRRFHRTGVVHVIYGTRRGLSAKGSQLWHQDQPGIAEQAELRDQFGQSLAAGDINGDKRDDLVVGVWFEDYRNDLSNEGGFHVIYGSRVGLRAKGNQFWNQDKPGVLDRTQLSDRFGQALAADDLNGDGFAEVIVGAPSSDLGKGIHDNYGSVHIFRGSARGLTAKGDRYLHQDSRGVMGKAEKWDHFGEALATGDYDGDGRADLAVGIPREDNASVEEGAVYVLPGSRTLVALDRDRLLRGASRLLTRAQERGAHFGWSMAGRMPASSTTRIANPKV